MADEDQVVEGTEEVVGASDRPGVNAINVFQSGATQDPDQENGRA